MLFAFLLVIFNIHLTADDIESSLKQLVGAKTLSYNLTHKQPNGKIEKGSMLMDGNVLLFEMPKRTIYVFDSLNVQFNHTDQSFSISFSDIGKIKEKLLNLSNLKDYVSKFQVDSKSDNSNYIFCNIASPNRNVLNSIWIRKNTNSIEKLEVKFFDDDKRTIKTSVTASEIRINQKIDKFKLKRSNFLLFRNGQWIASGKFSNYKIN
jgi:hypothetical protein